MKKISILTLLLTIIFVSCKENISFETEKVSDSQIEASIQFPVYKKYPEISKKAREIIEKDYEDYKKFNTSPDISFKLSYRTQCEDLSNSSFINLNIHKFIYAGPTIEDEYIISIVYNKKTKEFETIESLTGMEYEEYSKICQEEVFNQLDDISEKDEVFIKDWIKSGTQNMPIYWTAYNADKNYVTILFSQGQVLSNWYGTRSVKIQRKKR